MCILNCCKVITYLLLNASIASSENPPRAYEFLLVLIYVTIKNLLCGQILRNCTQFLCIQRYRSQSPLVGEATYLFMNILVAESFISNIGAKSLSMEQTEFQKKHGVARGKLFRTMQYDPNLLKKSFKLRRSVRLRKFHQSQNWIIKGQSRF